MATKCASGIQTSGSRLPSDAPRATSMPGRSAGSTCTQSGVTSARAATTTLYISGATTRSTLRNSAHPSAEAATPSSSRDRANHVAPAPTASPVTSTTTAITAVDVIVARPGPRWSLLCIGFPQDP